MIISFITGFVLCFSLNCVIGAQNTYLFRQGLINKYVFPLAFFCFLCDVILISFGVIGMNILINQDLLNWFFGFSSACLFFYGFLRAKSALQSTHKLNETIEVEGSFVKSISGMAALTLLNPHVYLDTVILIGSVSLKFNSFFKLTYLFGAFFASLIFFFAIAYLSRSLSSFMENERIWRIVDGLTAIIMFIVGYIMLQSSHWI